MNIVADVFARTTETYQGMDFDTDSRTLVAVPRVRYVAGSLIGHVIERDGLLYLTNDEAAEVYGRGERVATSLKMSTRATIAARRHFGRDVVVA